LLSPCSIGPIASKPPSLCAILYPIFPDCKSGKINTFAFPATGEVFNFFAATSGTKAASN